MTPSADLRTVLFVWRDGKPVPYDATIGGVGRGGNLPPVWGVREVAPYNPTPT